MALQTLSQKILHKNRAGGVAQGEGPEFKPQYCKTKNTLNLPLRGLRHFTTSMSQVQQLYTRVGTDNKSTIPSTSQLQIYGTDSTLSILKEDT
jgi:hypothetical protein